MASCPKKVVLATIAYLEDLKSRGLLELDEEAKSAVLEQIGDTIKSFMYIRKRYEANKKNHIPFGINLYSKSLFYGVAFKEESKRSQPLNANDLYDKSYEVALLHPEDAQNATTTLTFDHQQSQGEEFNALIDLLPKENGNNYSGARFAAGRVFAKSVTRALEKVIAEDGEFSRNVSETFRVVYEKILEAARNRDYFSVSILSSLYEEEFVRTFSELLSFSVVRGKNYVSNIGEKSPFFVYGKEVESSTVDISSLADDLESEGFFSGFFRRTLKEAAKLRGMENADFIDEIIDGSIDKERDFAIGAKIADMLRSDNFKREYQIGVVDEIFETLNENSGRMDVFKVLESLGKTDDFFDGSVLSELKKSQPLLSFDFWSVNGSFTLPPVVYYEFSKPEEEGQLQRAQNIRKLSYVVAKAGMELENGNLTRKLTPADGKFTIEYHSPKKMVLKDDHPENAKRFKRIMKANEAMNKSAFVSDKITEDFPIFIIDEADKALSGSLAMAIRSITKHSENIVAASGTPIGGYAREMAYQNAYGGLMNSEMIEKSKNEYAKQCGLYQFRSKFIEEIYLHMDIDDVAEELYAAYVSYIHALSEMKGKNKISKSENIYKVLEDVFYNLIETIVKVSDDENKSRDLESLSFEKEIKELERLFSNIKRLSSGSGMSISNTESFVEAFRLVVTGEDSMFIKEYPGINNPKTFVSLVRSSGNPNASVMSREILKRREERLHILDLDDHLRMFGSPTIEDEEAFFKNNYADIRVLQEAMRTYVSYEALDEVYWYVIKNFEMFANELKKKKENIKILAEKLGVSPSEAKSLISKTSSSSSDDILSLYKDYISVPAGREREIIDDLPDKKREAFETVLALFDAYFNKIHEPSVFGSVFSGDIDKATKVLKSALDGMEFKKFYVRSKLTSPVKNGGAVISTSENLRAEAGIPHFKEGESIAWRFVFSTDVDMCKRSWKKFLAPNEDGKYIPYFIRFNNKEENKIFDVFGSKGIPRICGNEIGAGRSFVLSSTRTGSNIFNLLNLLETAAERSDKTRTLSVIVNVDSGDFGETSLKDIVRRIDKDFLSKHNIRVVPTKRSYLDAEVKAEHSKGYQIVVVSNYESVSRGLDLSMLDRIVATGAMEKGKELTQFLARLYSVDRDDAEIYMFHGGGDMVPFVDNENRTAFVEAFKEAVESGRLDGIFESPDDGSIVKMIPELGRFTKTQTMRENLKGYAKLMTVKFFMSGRKSSSSSKIKFGENIVTLSGKTARNEEEAPSNDVKRTF